MGGVYACAHMSTDSVHRQAGRVGAGARGTPVGDKASGWCLRLKAGKVGVGATRWGME